MVSERDARLYEKGTDAAHHRARGLFAGMRRVKDVEDRSEFESHAGALALFNRAAEGYNERFDITPRDVGRGRVSEDPREGSLVPPLESHRIIFVCMILHSDTSIVS